jgi:hypothetical protein
MMPSWCNAVWMTLDIVRTDFIFFTWYCILYVYIREAKAETLESSLEFLV